MARNVDRIKTKSVWHGVNWKIVHVTKGEIQIEG
jgi:hypothetical protein